MDCWGEASVSISTSASASESASASAETCGGGVQQANLSRFRESPEV